MTSRTPSSPRLVPQPGVAFVFDPRTVQSVNTALASGRPLLVTGPPGSGKSSLAPAIAETLNFRYYGVAVRASLRARDLLYRWDEERQGRDAQIRAHHPPADYLEPGILWWAFDPASAAHPDGPARAAGPPRFDPSPPGRAAPAVVAIDDIDQADADLGLDVLQVLQAGRFVVAHDARVVQARTSPLVILTSSLERPLPPALARACVRLEMARPDRDTLVAIAQAHGLGARGTLLAQLADRFQHVAAERFDRGAVPPSTADFLDTVRAVKALGLKPGDAQAEQVIRSILGGGAGADAPAPPGETLAPPMAAGPDRAPGERCVFVCYARADQGFVLALAQALRRQVADLWLDQWSIPPGADWDAAIDHAIGRCRYFLVVLSPRSVASPEVQSELRQALNLRKRIIPVLLEPCEVPRRLNLLQHVEVRQRPGDDASLIDALARALRPDDPGDPPPTGPPDTPGPPPPPAAPPRAA